jgi:hypothetical protein
MIFGRVGLNLWRGFVCRAGQAAHMGEKEGRGVPARRRARWIFSAEGQKISKMLLPGSGYVPPLFELAICAACSALL